MGCSTLPTLTVTTSPSREITGTCFSPAPSLVLGTISCMGSPQQTTFTPLRSTYAITLPQWRQT